MEYKVHERFTKLIQKANQPVPLYDAIAELDPASPWSNNIHNHVFRSIAQRDVAFLQTHFERAWDKFQDGHVTADMLWYVAKAIRYHILLVNPKTSTAVLHALPKKRLQRTMILASRTKGSRPITATPVVVDRLDNIVPFLQRIQGGASKRSRSSHRSSQLSFQTQYNTKRQRVISATSDMDTDTQRSSYTQEQLKAPSQNTPAPRSKSPKTTNMDVTPPILSSQRSSYTQEQLLNAPPPSTPKTSKTPKTSSKTPKTPKTPKTSRRARSTPADTPQATPSVQSNVFDAFGDELALNTFSEILDRFRLRAYTRQQGGAEKIDLTVLDAADSMHDFGKNDVRSSSCPNEMNKLILKAHGKKDLAMYGFPFNPGYSEADFKRLYIVMNSYRVLPLTTVYKDVDPMSKLDTDAKTYKSIQQIANRLQSDMSMYENHVYLFDAYSGSLNSAVRDIWNEKNLTEITPLPKRVDPSMGPKKADNKIEAEFANLYVDIYSHDSIRIDESKKIKDIKNIVGKNSVKQLCNELSDYLNRSSKKNTDYREIKWVLDKKRIGDHGMVNFCANADAQVGELVIRHPPLFSFDNMCNVYSFEKNSPCIYNSYDVAAQKLNMETKLKNAMWTGGNFNFKDAAKAIMKALKPVQYFSAFKGTRGKVDEASLRMSYGTIVKHCEVISKKIKGVQGINVDLKTASPPDIANNTITVYLVQRGISPTQVVELHETPLDINTVLTMAMPNGLEVLYTPPYRIDFSDERAVSPRFEMLSRNIATLTHVSNMLERFESDVNRISSALTECILLAPSTEYVPANVTAYDSLRRSLRRQDSNKRVQMKIQVETAMKATAFVKLLRKYMGDVKKFTPDHGNQRKLLHMLCKHSAGVQQFIAAVKATMAAASLVGNADDKSRLNELQNLVDACDSNSDGATTGGNTATAHTLYAFDIMDIMLDDMAYL